MSVDGRVRVECLRMLRCCFYVCPATACCLTRATAGTVASNVVDLYNSATGRWSTALLCLARYGLAAASVGKVGLLGGVSLLSAFLCWVGAGD